MQIIKSRGEKMENLNQTKNELLLTSIYQNTQTALQSIDNILPSIKCDALATELSRQESEYNVISEECEMLAKSEGFNIKDNNFFEKIRLWSAIKMSTMTDKSTTHVTEMLLLGTFMGVITCIKDEAEHAGADEEITSLLNKLKSNEEKNIESLKAFL